MSEKETWDGDFLDRQTDAKALYQFMIRQTKFKKERGLPSNFVLNIDAPWGSGKTFFLKGFQKDIEENGHISVYINAWRDDHCSDPYIAIMAALQTALDPYLKKDSKARRVWKAVKKSGAPILMKVGATALKSLLKKTIGIDAQDIADSFSSQAGSTETVSGAIAEGLDSTFDEVGRLFDETVEEAISNFQKADRGVEVFREKLAALSNYLLAEKSLPVFILVDELDRCRPNYAVSLLERIKHLFDVDGFVFVFATDVEQLKHTISGFYGVGFNGFRYLKRFFDRTYKFGEPPRQKLVDHLCLKFPLEKIKAPEDKVSEAISTACIAFDLDIRATIQLIDTLEITVFLWPHKLPIEISLFIPLYIHFHRTNHAIWPTVDLLPELTKWVMFRSPVLGRDGFSHSKSYEFARIYEHAYSSLGSLESANRNTRRDNADTNAMYSNDIYWREINGINFLPNQKSIQCDLLDMITKARIRVSDN